MRRATSAKLIYRVGGKRPRRRYPTRPAGARRWARGRGAGPAGGPGLHALFTAGGASQGKGGEEDVHLGQEGGDGALPPELHLHIQREVAWLAHGALQEDHARVGVEAARAEVALLVALGDGQRDGVAGDGGHRADPEDVRGHQQPGLEVEPVVRDARGRVLAFQEVVAQSALAFPAGRTRGRQRRGAPARRSHPTPTQPPSAAPPRQPTAA